MKPSPVRPQENDDTKKILLIVDYSNLLYRSYFSSIKGWEQRPWLPILRFIDSLRLCVQRSKIPGIRIEVIFAGESREKLERTKLDSSYKSQRIPVTHDIFRNFRKVMARIIEDMDSSIISRAGAEADDIIASIVSGVCIDSNSPSNSFQRKYTDTIVFSNDKDLYQLLRYERCYIYRSPGFFYTKENFINDYKFDPIYFDIYKAMIGDKSDNISGVNGIGPVNATRHILERDIPRHNPQFVAALQLVQLDYELDVPDTGDILEFDFNLNRSRDYIYQFYGDTQLAWKEITLALKMLKAIYI